MSNNSRHSFKMQKRFDKEETARREKLGKQTTAPALDPQLGQIGEILEAPDPRTLVSLRRSHTA
ncbi:MAG: hypothetical protein WCC97_08495 [Candidatus Acidiferrales bacterium]